MAFDAGLAARIADALAGMGERAIRQKNVFGGRGFLVGKSTFAIARRNDVLVKVRADEYAERLAEPSISAFAPDGEHAMGTWLVVPMDVVADDPELVDWLRRGLAAVR